MRFRLKRLGHCLALAALMLSATVAWSQVTTANLSGSVQDSSGSVIPGAEIHLSNNDSGLTYNATSNEVGDFVFSVLPTGTYTLSIVSDGFKGYEATGIRLAASQNVRQVHALEVGALTETVTVEGAPPLIATQASEQTESINQEKVSELPLGRRNVTQVLKLSSGVDVGGGSLRINGMGKSGTGVTVNGTDANSNPSEGRSLENYGGRNYMDVMSIEGIEEVQIMRGIMKAENGGVISGTINLISKRGTNQWHGSALENYRSHIFNARDPFQTNRDDNGALLSKNREVFNQFGGSLGGPIVKNKLFFFGTFEGYRETASQRVSGTVPSSSLRQTILQALPFAETRSLIDTIPEPTVVLDEFRGRVETVGTRERRDNTLNLRADYRPEDNSNLSFSYTRGRPFGLDPRYNLNGANDREYSYINNRYNAQFTKTGSTWVSETRFGYNYSDMERLDNFFGDEFISPRGESVPWQGRIPRLNIQTPTGGIGMGSAEVWLMEGATTTYDQKFTLIRGNHTFKTGARVIWNTGNRTNPENPSYDFNSIEDMQAGIINGATISFGSNGPHTSRMYEVGGFVQDDWRVTSKLMLNLGLRYDYYSNNVVTPTGSIPVTNKNLESPTNGLQGFQFGARRPEDNPTNADSWVNLGPRAGFAFELNQKTVIRGGVGIMFAGQVPALMRQSVAGPDIPFRVSYSAAESAALGVQYPFTNEQIIPIALADIQSKGTELVFSLIDPNLQNPYTINYQFNIQRQLSRDLMWEIGYVGTRGVKWPMHRRFNLPDRETGIRPNPLIIPGGPYYVDSSESVMNHSLQTSLRKRMSNNLSFDVHYTWGKTFAYQGGDVGVYYGTDAVANIQEFFDVSIEKGNPGFDTTHRVVADIIYELPQFTNMSGPVKTIIGGWQMSAIYSGNTGNPLTVNQGCSNGWACRGDYVGGNIRAADGATFGSPRVGSHQDVQYINPAAFEPITEVGGVAIRPGNVANGFVRGPGQWNVDFSLSKKIQISETVGLQLRADMFNFLNHVNLTSLEGRADNSDFGTLDAARSMRNMQMGARITF
jgi:outer membrane receptor protein involved in Fe transport